MRVAVAADQGVAPSWPRAVGVLAVQLVPPLPHHRLSSAWTNGITFVPIELISRWTNAYGRSASTNFDVKPRTGTGVGYAAAIWTSVKVFLARASGAGPNRSWGPFCC